ncbi:MAG TPA: UDP-N-acetylglucosamine 2-epimerase (non-hydrolyzing) [Xanthobacteraceae bacterium]|nr:UDP-N-acetylglucosamine 2-epimerase (non-hydrolyzing) [Xanthobacteraceae bacterium]
MNLEQPPRLRCACVVGTRPEVIKMAPVIRRLGRTDWAAPVVVATGQQDGLLGQALADFAIVPDHAIAHSPKGGNLISVLAAIVAKLDDVFAQVRPALVVAQGDTTSVFAASLAAFYRDIPFVHVEAGLRTGDLLAPFPEEFHRRAIAIATLLHCAPTEAAALHLREENIPADHVLMCGNTVIDALIETAAAAPAPPHGFPQVAKPILLTAHRRENFGEPLREAFAAIRDFVDAAPDTAVYFPVHPNPAARSVAYRVLSGHPRIVLAEPASYGEIVGAIQRAWLVVTDSGGLQEEAPALGKPVLVLRDVTERPEAVAAGAVRVIGTRHDQVRDELRHLHRDAAAYAGMARPVFPYGDGHAAQRIVAALERRMIGRAVMPATTQQHGGQAWTH